MSRLLKRFGLIGFPLTHSFSKKYFTEKFAREGLSDHVYDLFPIPARADLPALLQQHPDLYGLNVTIPYKQEVLPFLDEQRIPLGVAACNCIRIRNGRLTGYNTDVVGFQQSFAPGLQPYHTHALVLGSGGAAAAVVYVLQKLGIQYRVVSRNSGDPSKLTYADLSRDIIAQHTVIINTTPLGTFPAVEVCPPIPYEWITQRHYAFDLVYNPAKTLFLQKAEEKGALIRNGYEMLLLQAEEGWRIWNEPA